MGEGFRKKHPDITLMNLQMPTMHGTDAIVAKSQRVSGTRIIVPTTYSAYAHVVAIALKRGIIELQ